MAPATQIDIAVKGARKMTYDTNRTASNMGTIGAPSSRAWGLVKTSDIEGRSVIGLDDEHIGSIEDLYLDYDEHSIRNATVDVGGFLGIGAKTVLIPFEMLQWSGANVYLPVQRQVLEDAPEFDPEAAYYRSYEEQVTQAWGTDIYWTQPGYGTNHSHWREGYDRTIL
jgi:sporulation protein YlmC with PRC-barrel domain